MSNKSRRGPKKKKKPAREGTVPPLKLVKGGKDGDGAPPPKSPKPPKPAKVRPLPPEKEVEWLIAEAEEATLTQKKNVNGLEQQLLERDETILGLRKEIVALRGSALHEEEEEAHSKNKAILASLDLKKGECVMKIGGKLSIGPLSMVGPEGEKKSG